MSPARILVVEDETEIRAGICDVLAFQGHEPTGVESGEEGAQKALDGSFDLVLLDVMLPGINGFDVCESLRRARPELPIVMLTAKGSEEDILEGFARGSDDYITKPFSVKELLARVTALLRRAEVASPPRNEAFEFGPWTIDPPTLRAQARGDSIELSPREVAILALLVSEQGRIVSRRLLLREVWEAANAENMQTRTVDMHIAKLRKKVDKRGGNLIETVRGAGYRYVG